MKFTSLITAGILGAALASQAALLDWTAGLAEDAEYRIVFLTSTTTQATSTDIGIYNAFVNAAADLNSELDAISWTAMGSTADDNVRDNTGTTGAGTGIGIYLLNDTKIADDYADLWDGSIDAIFDRDENGDEQYNKLVWTGTQSSGTTHSSSLGTAKPRAGKTNFSDGSWMARLGMDNTNTYNMYAMSEVLTVAVPAETLYIGDSAAEGTNVTAGTTSYGLSDLTIAMHTGSPVIYTAPSDQDLTLTEVNFYTDATGTVTPFVARYDGTNSTLGSGYEILAIGDPITVTNATA